MWQVTQHAHDGRRSLTFEEFERSLPELCLSHRAQGRALAFALVLCDASQPHLRKALQDEQYWQALDALSGRALTVFSFEFEPWAAPRYRPQRQSLAPNQIGFLVGVRASPAEATFDVLATHFPGFSLERLPAVLFFQVDGSGNILDSCAADLPPTPGDPSAAYNSLHTVLNVAAVSLNNVDDENAENAREIFQLIVEGLHGLRVKGRIRRVFSGAKTVTTVVGVARMIAALVKL